MHDITNRILEARANGGSWSTNLFFVFIEQLEAFGFSVSFWEGEERWATIMKGDVTIGYLWRRYPLLLIANEHAAVVPTFTNEVGFISVVRVDSLYAPVLVVSDYVLMNEVDLELNNPFSAEDIWFYNNSL